MKKGDVGMAKHFSKKYGNKEWAFDYPVSAIWNKFLRMPVNAWCCIPTSLPQKQVAKSFSCKGPAKWVFNKLCTLSRVVANTCIWLTTHPCSFKSTTLAILQPRFCKVDYRSVNVQCPNSTQDNTNDVSGGSDVGM